MYSGRLENLKGKMILINMLLEIWCGILKIAVPALSGRAVLDICG